MPADRTNAAMSAQQSAPQSAPKSAKDILAHLISFDTTSFKTNIPMAEWIATYLAGHGVESRLRKELDVSWSRNRLRVAKVSNFRNRYFGIGSGGEYLR